ncbi:hypothetical protein [Pandoraea sp. NPDC087047]|uniref:hypothetical protein n=1 Tax=Pandoraea sp. NPDC087047 TaxID=3364390 RepID=UPI0038273423
MTNSLTAVRAVETVTGLVEIDCREQVSFSESAESERRVGGRWQNARSHRKTEFLEENMTINQLLNAIS